MSPHPVCGDYEIIIFIHGYIHHIPIHTHMKRDIALQNQFADLCRVCRNGELDLLKEFLYYKKEILTYQPPPSYTSVLHEAVEGDQPDVIQLLILHDFNPDVQARGGLTPLHLAVIKAKISCVHALIKNGADLSKRDEQGQDAIAKAKLSKKREGVLNLLRSKGMYSISLLIPKRVTL